MRMQVPEFRRRPRPRDACHRAAGQLKRGANKSCSAETVAPAEKKASGFLSARCELCVQPSSYSGSRGPPARGAQPSGVTAGKSRGEEAVTAKESARSRIARPRRQPQQTRRGGASSLRFALVTSTDRSSTTEGTDTNGRPRATTLKKTVSSGHFRAFGGSACVPAFRQFSGHELCLT